MSLQISLQYIWICFIYRNNIIDNVFRNFDKFTLDRYYLKLRSDAPKTTVFVAIWIYTATCSNQASLPNQPTILFLLPEWDLLQHVKSTLIFMLQCLKHLWYVEIILFDCIRLRDVCICNTCSYIMLKRCLIIMLGNF